VFSESVLFFITLSGSYDILKDERISSYLYRQKGVGIAEQYLGHGHPMSKALKNSCWSLEHTIPSNKLKSHHCLKYSITGDIKAFLVSPQSNKLNLETERHM